MNSSQSGIEVSTQLGTEPPFVRIEDATEMVRNSYGRPGAIVIAIDGVEFIGPDLFDEIDTFWPSFLEGVDELRKAGSGRAEWTDQSIQVDYSSLDTSSGDTFVHMRLVIGNVPVDGREAHAELGAYCQAVGDAALFFFEKATLLEPDRFPPETYYKEMVERWRNEDA